MKMRLMIAVIAMGFALPVWADGHGGAGRSDNGQGGNGRANSTRDASSKSPESASKTSKDSVTGKPGDRALGQGQGGNG